MALKHRPRDSEARRQGHPVEDSELDLKARPEPDQKRPELKQAFVAPRAPVEEVLVGTWGQLLGVERVGVHDNFFKVGGIRSSPLRQFSGCVKTSA
jgi:hypothetical protein